jgi:hypothetical protein
MGMSDFSDVLAASFYGKQTTAGSRKSKRKKVATTTDAENKAPWEEQYSFDIVPSRTWKPYEQEFPCYPPRDDHIMSEDPCHEGILFQRPTKVGSTTMTNIVLRLSHNRGAIEAKKMEELQSTNHAQKAWKKRPHCRHRSNHKTSVDLDYVHRNKKKSFLFSLVRDPTKRRLSTYFHFRVTYLQEDPTDENFQKFAINRGQSNAIIRDLTFDPGLSKKMSVDYERFLVQWGASHGGISSRDRPIASDLLQNGTVRETLDYAEIVRDILESYDFIAVTERMDESLVAFKLLLGLTVEEILYAKASRSAGSFSNGNLKTRPCMYLIPPFLTDGMNDFFYTPGKNDRWIEYSRGDALLHRAASLSLDRTIDEVFGRKNFEKHLEEFRNAQAYAQAVCSSAPDLVQGMCDEAGNSVELDPNRTKTCYIWSEGCDHKCLNELVPNPIPRAILEGRFKFGQ